MAARGLSVFVDIGAKVGSSVNASASKVETRFAQMARKIKVASAEFGVAMSRFQRASQGVSGLIAAGGIGFTLSKAIGAGAEYDHELQALRNAGRTATDVAEAIAAANKTIIALPTSTLAGNLAMINETTSAFGDYHHALENVGRNQKLSFLLSNSAGEHGGDRESQTRQIGDLIRTLEMRGAANDPKRYDEETELAYKAMMFTRGRVGGSEFRAFASTGNPIVKTLSNDYMYKVLPALMQEYGADQTGTMHQSLANTILGKVGMGGAHYAAEWMRLGLLDKSQAKTAKNGSVKGWNAGAIKGTEIFLKDPLKWVEEFVLPAFQKAGVNVDDQVAVQIELSKLIGKNTAARLMGSLVNSNDRRRLHKDAAFTEQVQGMDQAYVETLLNDPKTAMAGIKAAMSNFMASIAGPILIPAARGLMSIARGLNHIAVFFQENPGIAKATGALVAALAGFMAMGVVGNVIKFLGAGLEVFGAAASIASRGAGWLFKSFAPLRYAMVFARYGFVALLGVAWPVALAIGAVAAAVAILIAKWNGVKAFFSGFVEGFKNALSPETKAAMERLGQAFADFGTAVGNAFGPLIDMLKGVWQWIAKLFSPADAERWGQAGQSFGGVIGGMVNDLAGFIIKIAEAIQSVTNLMNLLRNNPFAGAMVGGPGVTAGNAGAAVTGGGVAGSALGAAAGGVAGKRALGGPVRGGGWYRINESGQEFFAPGRDGHIITARATAALMSAANTNARSANGNGPVNIVINGAQDPQAVAREVDRHLRRHARAATGYLSD